MYKLWASIIKDTRILLRDKMGLALIFAMPILLVIIVTSIQNSTFQLVNKSRLNTLLCNRDTGQSSKEFIAAMDKVGLFSITNAPADADIQKIKQLVTERDAMLAIVIPENFSEVVHDKAAALSSKALVSFGLPGDSAAVAKVQGASPITLYYEPVLQDAYRFSIEGALQSALQLVGSKEMLKQLYFSINDKPLPVEMEQGLMASQTQINDIPLSKNGRDIPNATQHNVPSWTIFAMFFIILSLGGSVVREKRSGSFIRLKTLPTPFWVGLLSKQLTYLVVTFLQAVVIFSMGIWLFPHIGLPGLKLPADIFALVCVTIACGWCAVSYAICVGIFAETQEQANGFGAISIVILAALGGLMVPSFAMPSSFTSVTRLSPLHWCLEAYYNLFLKDGTLAEVLPNILYLIAITITFQLLTLWGLRRKNLI
jgi:ABC-2 type transport system permease protein